MERQPYKLCMIELEQDKVGQKPACKLLDRQRIAYVENRTRVNQAGDPQPNWVVVRFHDEEERAYGPYGPETALRFYAHIVHALKGGIGMHASEHVYSSSFEVWTPELEQYHRAYTRARVEEMHKENLQ